MGRYGELKLLLAVDGLRAKSFDISQQILSEGVGVCKLLGIAGQSVPVLPVSIAAKT